MFIYIRNIDNGIIMRTFFDNFILNFNNGGFIPPTMPYSYYNQYQPQQFNPFGFAFPPYIGDSFSAKSTTPASTSNTNTTQNNEAVTDSGNKTPYDSLILKYAKKYEVEPDFVRAVIKAESRFDKGATSYCGAQGLMQLMPATARSLGVNNAYDPEQNIEGGTKFLSQLLKKYNGNKELAAAAYNAGPGRVKDHVPQIKQTQVYVKRVMKFYGEYNKMA